MMMLTRASRGQAIVETALMLPLVLACIVFLFWAGKEAVMSERLENTARYTEQVLNSVNDYNGYSLLSFYDMSIYGGAHVDSGTNNLCTATPVNNLLTSAFNVGGQAQSNGDTTPQATLQSASLWTDQTVGTPTCTNGGVSVLGLSRPLMLAYSREIFTIQTRAPLGGWEIFSEGASGNQFQSSTAQQQTPPQVTAQTMVQIDAPTMQMMFNCDEELHDGAVGGLWLAARGTGDTTPPWSGGSVSDIPSTSPPGFYAQRPGYCT